MTRQCGKIGFAEGVRAFYFCQQTAAIYGKPEPLSKAMANVGSGILYGNL